MLQRGRVGGERGIGDSGGNGDFFPFFPMNPSLDSLLTGTTAAARQRKIGGGGGAAARRRLTYREGEATPLDRRGGVAAPEKRMRRRAEKGL